MCLSGDIPIHALDGDVTAAEAAHRGRPLHVYTWDGQRITVGFVVVRKAGLRIPVLITLDDGSRICVGVDDRLYSRKTGGPLPATKLVTGDAVLPLYKKVGGGGHVVYYEPLGWNRGAPAASDAQKWRRTARMVAEYKLGRRMVPGDTVTLVDGNKANLNPSNISIQTREPKQRTIKVGWVEALKDAHKLINDLNHKIITTEIGVSRDMFTINGLATDNFAAGGVFLSVDSE